MACNNFVCAFSHVERGKVYCFWSTDSCRNAPDCTATSQNSCERFKYFSCKICGHDYQCFKQREKGVFYSAQSGFYTPKETSKFIQAVQHNELINAKRDIYATAVRNYCQGYRTSTTIRQLYEKYGKRFPQFTKNFLDEAVHKSIIQYLKTEV